MSDQVIIEPLTVSKGDIEELRDQIETQQNQRTTGKLHLLDTPKILMQDQIRWQLDNSPVRLKVKCRRVGGSWGVASEGALEAATDKGMDQFYMGYCLDMATENIGDALMFSKVYGTIAREMNINDIKIHRFREILGDKHHDITKFLLRYASGYVYEALSSSPWNWRGRQGHARIDEAGYHNNLKETITGALAFLMWGGRVDIISTLNGEDNYFFELVKEQKAGKLPGWSLHWIDFTQAISEGFYKRICLVKGWVYSKEAEQAWRQTIYDSYPDQEDARQELDCIPKRGSGAYFTRMLIENCMIEGIPIIRWTKPAEFVTNPNRLQETKAWIMDNLKPVIDQMTGHRSVYGQDFGRTGDLSNNWVLQERTPHKWTMAFMLELRNLPFDVQAMIRDYVLENIPLFHHASFDSRGNGQSHAEGALQRYGQHKVTCVFATAQFYSEWFPKYRQTYEDQSFVIAKSEDIIADHRQIELVKGRPTMSDKRIKGSDGEFRHGDSAIGGLMVYHATQQEGYKGSAYHDINLPWIR